MFCPKVLLRPGFAERGRVRFCSKLEDSQHCHQVQRGQGLSKTPDRYEGSPKKGGLDLASSLVSQRQEDTERAGCPCGQGCHSHRWPQRVLWLCRVRTQGSLAPETVWEG